MRVSTFLLTTSLTAATLIGAPGLALAGANDIVPGTEKVKDLQSFWQNEMELAPDGDVFKMLPPEMQSCIVDEIIKATPDELDATVGRFVEKRTKGNYAKIIAPLMAFATDFKKEHGARLGEVAGKTCMEKLTE